MAFNHTLLEAIRDGLSQALGKVTELEWIQDLPGGDINRAALIRSRRTKWFVKYHVNAPEGMFAAEALALLEIAHSDCIQVPSPIAYGNDGNTAWLVLEYLELSSNGLASQLGEQLAALHTITNNRYGWSRDNYIGTTPQRNTRCEKWAEFWREYRLRPQLKMAQTSGHGGQLISQGERLLENIDLLMDGHQPAASLLHGDLWAGNKAFSSEGQAVIFDPASYYGDRETDIAMTELFGGFEPAFYSAYLAQAPLPDGYPLRRDLYNLYHMLNHLNLFGEAYLYRCQNMIAALLAQIH